MEAVLSKRAKELRVVPEEGCRVGMPESRKSMFPSSAGKIPRGDSKCETFQKWWKECLTGKQKLLV